MGTGYIYTIIQSQEHFQPQGETVSYFCDKLFYSTIFFINKRDAYDRN